VVLIPTNLTLTRQHRYDANHCATATNASQYPPPPLASLMPDYAIFVVSLNHISWATTQASRPPTRTPWSESNTSLSPFPQKTTSIGWRHPPLVSCTMLTPTINMQLIPTNLCFTHQHGPLTPAYKPWPTNHMSTCESIEIGIPAHGLSAVDASPHTCPSQVVMPRGCRLWLNRLMSL
jgi:hypothetical protein